MTLINLVLCFTIFQLHSLQLFRFPKSSCYNFEWTNAIFKAINFYVKRKSLKPVDNGVEIAFPWGNVIDCVTISASALLCGFFLEMNSAKGINGGKDPQLRLDECHLVKCNMSCVRGIVFTKFKGLKVLHWRHSHALRFPHNHSPITFPFWSGALCTFS